MLTLQEQLGDPALTIWAFSYIGHETKSPSLVPTGHTSILTTQMIMMTIDHTDDLDDDHPQTLPTTLRTRWITNWL